MKAKSLEALCSRIRDRHEPEGMMAALAAEPFPLRKVMPDLEARMRKRKRLTIGDVPHILRHWRVSAAEETMFSRIVEEAYYSVKPCVSQENWRRAIKKAEAEEARRQKAAEQRISKLAAQSAYDELFNPTHSFAGLDRSGKVVAVGSRLDACRSSGVALVVRVKPKFRYAA